MENENKEDKSISFTIFRRISGHIQLAERIFSQIKYRLLKADKLGYTFPIDLDYLKWN